VLALTSKCSAASRREAPLATRPITRSRMSPEYAFGIFRLPKRINADKFPHPAPVRNLSDSIGEEHALGACLRNEKAGRGDDGHWIAMVRHGLILSPLPI
jgi:hypothetical protein